MIAVFAAVVAALSLSSADDVFVNGKLVGRPYAIAQVLRTAHCAVDGPWIPQQKDILIRGDQVSVAEHGVLRIILTSRPLAQGLAELKCEHGHLKYDVVK